MRDFDSVFNHLPADAKVSGNLARSPALDDEAAQGFVRDQGRSANRISGLFVIVIIVASQCLASSSTIPHGRSPADNRETIWLMAQEDVRNFFHQGGAISLLAVRGI